MEALLSQTMIEMKLFLRRRGELLWTMAFPVMFILLFGVIYGNSKWAGMDMRSIDYMLPGIVMMAAMMTGIMRTCVGFIGEREKGIYRRLALTPLKRYTLIGAQLLHHYAVILVQTVLLIAIGVAVFKTHITANVFVFWLVLSAAAFSFLSIGFALTGLIKTSRAAMPVNQMAYFFLMFLGGLFFPNSMLPEFLAKVANALPSTQACDALRAVCYQGAGFGDIWPHLLALAAWAVACIVISLKFFRWE
jgi:ABC-2 type transport system permease protein